jgi:hypothetical protein
MALDSYEPTVDEMREVWKRTGLRQRRHTFEQDMQVPVIAQSLRRAVLAKHKSNELPQQGSLLLESET